MPCRGFCIHRYWNRRDVWSIRFCRQAGVKGVVIGALTTGRPSRYSGTGTYDYSSYHKTSEVSTAYDCIPPCIWPVEQNRLPFWILLWGLGFDALLTSGQGATAEEGIPVLDRLVRQANGRIQIMAGKGVTLENVDKIIRKTRRPPLFICHTVPNWTKIAAQIKSSAPTGSHKCQGRFP